MPTVTFCEHGQLKGWQPHFQPTVVKSSIPPTTIHCLAVVTWKHRRSEYSLTSPGDHNSVTKPSASLYKIGFFCSCNKGMGMMQPQCRAGGAYCRTAALRDLKLLVGSGCLEFPKGMSGMDSWNKHVEQISFRQCVTFSEYGQLKGWQPHFQPAVAKSKISTHCNSRHGKRKKNTFQFSITTLEDHNTDQTFCFSEWDTNPESSRKGWDLLLA